MEDLCQSLHRTLDAAQAYDVRESLDVARSLRFCRFEITLSDYHPFRGRLEGCPKSLYTAIKKKQISLWDFIFQLTFRRFYQCL